MPTEILAVDVHRVPFSQNFTLSGGNCLSSPAQEGAAARPVRARYRSRIALKLQWRPIYARARSRSRKIAPDALRERRISVALHVLAAILQTDTIAANFCEKIAEFSDGTT